MRHTFVVALGSVFDAARDRRREGVVCGAGDALFCRNAVVEGCLRCQTSSVVSGTLHAAQRDSFQLLCRVTTSLIFAKDAFISYVHGKSWLNWINKKNKKVVLED